MMFFGLVINLSTLSILPTFSLHLSGSTSLLILQMVTMSIDFLILNCILFTLLLSRIMALEICDVVQILALSVIVCHSLWLLRNSKFLWLLWLDSCYQLTQELRFIRNCRVIENFIHQIFLVFWAIYVQVSILIGKGLLLVVSYCFRILVHLLFFFRLFHFLIRFSYL